MQLLLSALAITLAALAAPGAQAALMPGHPSTVMCFKRDMK
jgi:hypothetical protein